MVRVSKAGLGNYLWLLVANRLAFGTAFQPKACLVVSCSEKTVNPTQKDKKSTQIH
jgi:hypothetical protein